jgi:PleD family two-component response regulator
MRSLLKEADAVLYEVKEQGKNNFKYVVKKDA